MDALRWACSGGSFSRFGEFLGNFSLTLLAAGIRQHGIPVANVCEEIVANFE